MANRLEFFKQQMAAFEGSANPSKAINSGYYMTEPRNSVSDLIAGRIALRPASTHLILGGIGSGKTTQLLVTLNRVNKLPNTYARYIDVSTYTDISKISAGVLITVVGLTFASLLISNREEVIKNSIDVIQKIAYGYSEIRQEKEESNLFGLSYLGGRTITKEVSHYHKGILSTEGIQQSNELIQAVLVLYNSVKSEYEQICFMFDGLDRLIDSQSFLHLVTHDMRELSNMGIGCVLIGSIFTLHEEYKNHEEYKSMVLQSVDYIGYQSCFDVEQDEDAYKFFESIIRNRTSNDFIASDVIRSIVMNSGGILRDLINITQLSIEEAYFSDNEEILLQSHVDKAVESFGRAKLMGLTKSDMDILRDFAKGNKLFSSSRDELKLLSVGKIVEYRYPKRRYSIHPTLLPMLALVEA
jgi:hypothetical protein